MIYQKEMELTRDIVVAQLSSSKGYIGEDTIKQSIEVIFKTIRDLTDSDNRGPRTLA